MLLFVILGIELRLLQELGKHLHASFNGIGLYGQFSAIFTYCFCLHPVSQIVYLLGTASHFTLPAAGLGPDSRAFCPRVLAFSYISQVSSESSLGSPNSGQCL